VTTSFALNPDAEADRRAAHLGCTRPDIAVQHMRENHGCAQNPVTQGANVISIVPQLCDNRMLQPMLGRRFGKPSA
jgi:hypothetical protein